MFCFRMKGLENSRNVKSMIVFETNFRVNRGLQPAISFGNKDQINIIKDELQLNERNFDVNYEGNPCIILLILVLK